MGFRELLGNEEREISHLKGIGILAGQGGYFYSGKFKINCIKRKMKRNFSGVGPFTKTDQIVAVKILAVDCKYYSFERMMMEML